MEKQTLTIDSRTERLATVREFVSDAARKLGFDENDVGDIALAVDEACTNVIKHAYRFDETQSLTVTVSAGKGLIEITVTDTGRGFDPESLETPDMRAYLASYQKGGLGVYLMKKLMDRVEYQLIPGKRNEVRLVKYLSR